MNVNIPPHPTPEHHQRNMYMNATLKNNKTPRRPRPSFMRELVYWWPPRLVCEDVRHAIQVRIGFQPAQQHSLCAVGQTCGITSTLDPSGSTGSWWWAVAGTTKQVVLRWQKLGFLKSKDIDDWEKLCGFIQRQRIGNWIWQPLMVLLSYPLYFMLSSACLGLGTAWTRSCTWFFFKTGFRTFFALGLDRSIVFAKSRKDKKRHLNKF